jgi:hypothetical protein
VINNLIILISRYPLPGVDLHGLEAIRIALTRFPVSSAEWNLSRNGNGIIGKCFLLPLTERVPGLRAVFGA